MRATLALLTAALCLLPLAFLVPEQASAANITIEVQTFGNGETSIAPELFMGGIDSSNGLSLQTGLFVEEARLKLHSMAPAEGDTAYPSNISIDVGGDGFPEWRWLGQGVGPLGRQNLFTNGLNYLNLTVPEGGGNNLTQAIRLPKTAKVTSASMNISGGQTIGTPGKILCIYAEYPGYGWQTDPINRLRAFSSDFNTVDSYNAQSGTPSWDYIKDYSGILIWNNGWNYGYQFASGANLGNLMADYVDAGGGLVIADYAMWQSGNSYLTGRFNTGGYYCMGPSGSIYYMYGGYGITINDASHPLFRNFNSINWNYWGYTYNVGASVASGATELARDNYNGMCFAATKNINGVDRVDLNFWPISYETSNYGYFGYGGDGDDLMRNALLFSGRKPINITFDLFDDGNIDFTNDTFSGNYTVLDFSAELNDYLGSHDATYTDDFGNSFVDVPVNLTSPKLGKVQLNNLKILYDYDTDIVENPAMGNLTMSLADIMPVPLGSSNATIPIVVTTTSAGRFLLDNLYIKLTPPRHAPTILSFFPPQDITVLENSQLDFGVNVTDIYGNPFEYQWYFDGAGAGNATDRFSTSFDYDSAGDHVAKVELPNGLRTASMEWKITVKNVDRSPVIERTDPASETWNMSENSNYTFSVTASDLDGDPLSYAWALDGAPVPKATGHNCTYFADFASAGDHKLKVMVSDPFGMSVSMGWTVQVQNVNVAPVIMDWYPKDDPTFQERQSWTFGVSASDTDGQPLTIKWYVDDVEAFSGNPYIYTTDYRSAGVHKIKAVASDGGLSVSREWKATVVNLNRMPVVVIDAPKSMQEFMEGAAIHFSAKSSYDPDGDILSFNWKESGTNLSDQSEFDRPFLHGIHTLVVEVSDGIGGTNQSAIRFKVRWVELSLVIGLDRVDVVTGDKVQVIITLTNVGDTGSSADASVELLVDGRTVDSKNITSISAGGSTKLLFTWKATKGSHTMTAKIGEQAWSKPVTVAAAPGVEGTVLGADVLVTLLIIVLAVALAAWGFMALRKK